MHVVPSPNPSDPLSGSDELRVYQTWKVGINYFLQRRFILGPDVKSLALTIFLIVGPVAVFCGFVARKLIMVIAIAFTFYDLILLLLLTSSRMHTKKYIFFFMFGVSTTLLCVYVFGFCWFYIKRIMVTDDEITSIWRAMSKTPASIVLIIYTFIAFWFVGGLTAFHLYLISTNQISRVFASYRPEASTPPQRNLLLVDAIVSIKPVFADIDETTVCLLYLPWDITTEILSRLPVKSLMRFKCVSKSFYDLISKDSVFKRKHLYHRRHHQSSLKILAPQSINQGKFPFSCSISSLTPGDNMIHELELPVQIGNPIHKNGRFHKSCDGLFCIQVYCRGVIIWNPSTRQVKELPGIHHRVENYIGYPSGIVYSLAHDSCSDIYKLLGVFKCSYLHPYRLCFYSSEMEKWRDVEDSSCPPCDYVRYDVEPTIVNGAFHWVGSHDKYFKTTDIVVSLDIGDETYGSLALPQALFDATEYPMLCALKGKLCFFGDDSFKLYHDIWVMNEYGVVDSLAKMFSISCVELPSQYCWPLYVLEDDTFVMCSYGQTSFYKDGRFLCDTSVGGFKFPLSHVYLESLISPHII